MPTRISIRSLPKRHIVALGFALWVFGLVIWHLAKPSILDKDDHDLLDQYSDCDANWLNWSEHCFRARTDLRDWLKSRGPIRIAHTEVHPAVRRMVEGLPTYLGLDNLQILYLDTFQLSAVARNARLGAEELRVNGTAIYMRSLGATIHEWRLCPRPHVTRRKFYTAFAEGGPFRSFLDPDRFDLFYFSAPPTVAELFFSLDVPTLVQAPYGLELTRNYRDDIGGPYFWESVQLFRAAATCSKCATPKWIATQSLYEQEIYLYHMDMRLPRLPMHADYVVERYAPPEGTNLVYVTIGSRPHESYPGWVKDPKELFSPNGGARRWNITHLEHPFTFEQIARSRAIVYIPYKHATNFFLEIYALNIPIFVPSPRFYASLDLRYDLGRERLWCGGPPRVPLKQHAFHPIDRDNLEANKYWNAFGDHYVYPFVHQFDTWEDLLDILDKVDFEAVSASMARFSEQLTNHIKNKWYLILQSSLQSRNTGKGDRSGKTFDERMESLYGMKFPDEASDLEYAVCAWPL